MKIYYIIPVLLSIFLSCTNAQDTEKTLLNATEFSEKIKATTSPIVVDVRTPGEYAQGHLQNAKNIDWNGTDFEKQISQLDTSEVVFVYCLSGGRSASAANKMREMGFSKVYELDGGILKWRKANLPETTGSASKSAGITKQQFDSLITSDQFVLVDFFAPWCAPCKKMKPYLTELEVELKGKVTIIRIDADENAVLFKALNLETLPTLQLYKNKKVTWSHTGYISKEDIAAQLK